MSWRARMFEVTVDPAWGYRRLDPLPTEDELSAFYQSGYYDLLRSEPRAPDLTRLQEGGEEAELEREWLRETLFLDVIDWATDHNGGPGLILEVGSGLGDMVEEFACAGWTAIGLEPAVKAAEDARERGLDVRTQTLEEFMAGSEVAPDVIVLRFVLEHVRDPISLLRSVHSCLRPLGLVIIEVPNDFNPLQEAAREAHQLERWWVAAPDHINYFDFDSLTTVLERLGFGVVQRSTSFPMEMFLLMGDNFVGDPAIGEACHRRRRSFEMNIEPALRRSLYSSLAGLGLGRSCLMAAIAR